MIKEFLHIVLTYTLHPAGISSLLFKKNIYLQDNLLPVFIFVAHIFLNSIHANIIAVSLDK